MLEMDWNTSTILAEVFYCIIGLIFAFTGVSALKNKEVEKRTTTANNLDEFVEKINTNQGFIKTMWCGKQECEDKIQELTGAHSRCMPFNQEQIGDKCVCCGAPAKIYMIWGRQY